MQFAEVWQAAFWLRVWTAWQVVPEGKKMMSIKAVCRDMNLPLGEVKATSH
jgi:hypothetical protein